jgi:hypothetical protein
LAEFISRIPFSAKMNARIAGTPHLEHQANASELLGIRETREEWVPGH